MTRGEVAKIKILPGECGFVREVTSFPENVEPKELIESTIYFDVKLKSWT